MRFALGIVAEVLCTQSPRGHVLITKLLKVARAIVEDATINQAGAGPAIYLLKVIVRRYGISFMIDMQKQHNWLVPSSFPKSEKVYMYFQFVIVECFCHCVPKLVYSIGSRILIEIWAV